MSFAAGVAARNAFVLAPRVSLRNAPSAFRANIRHMGSSQAGSPRSDKPWIIASTLIFVPAFLYVVYPDAKKDAHPVHHEKQDSNALKTQDTLKSSELKSETIYSGNKVNAAELLKTSQESPNTTSHAPAMRSRVEEYIFTLQESIVAALEDLDPSAAPFKRDSWLRAQGGEGRSCVFAAPTGNLSSANSPQTIPILEKAGVNTSVVHGTLPPAAIQQMRADHTSVPLPNRPEGLPFFAAGISLIIHPRNPNAPTVHANYRYFEITEPQTDEQKINGEKPKVLAWWFGGGCDLTPSYLFEEDAAHFHGTLKKACDKHGEELYPRFKAWCDEYFYIPHRGETRGIGGIFFDDLNQGPHKRLSAEEDGAPRRPTSPDEIFAFIKELGNSFVPSYLPILSARHKLPYTDLQRRWQLLRRGRYVEFNLVYDRGTKFGLMTPGARIESILMSLPETARWEYMSELGREGTDEAKLVEALKKPRDWA